jgi:hypothetical protein
VRLSYGHSSTQVPTSSCQIIPTHLFIVHKAPLYWNPHLLSLRGDISLSFGEGGI